MQKKHLAVVPLKRVLKTLLIMKLFIVFLLTSALQVVANEGRSQETITVDFKKTKLSKALKEIEKNSQFRFVFSNHILKEDFKISVSAKKITITELLSKMLTATGLVFERLDNNLFVIKGVDKPTIVATVKGRITNSKGEPLRGVSVTAKSGAGTTTNESGEYTITVGETDVLTFSYVGYATETVNVNSQTVINITLEEKADTQLEEVVVTALGIKREERSLGFARQKVDGEQLAIVKGANVVTSLTGKVAGLRISNTTEFWESSGILKR